MNNALSPTSLSATRPQRSAYLNDPAGYRTAIGAFRDQRRNSPAPGGTPVPAPVPAPGGTPAPNALSPQMQALNGFADSAGMQFQQQQGANAINNLYAARGQIESGAAMKALQNYGQQTALQNYFMPYMGLLGGQQAVGAGAASSIAGVGNNFGNTAANINSNMANGSTNILNGMGAIIGNNADNASNAAIARGAANAQLGSSIGSALGSFGSSFFAPSTYGR